MEPPQGSQSALKLACRLALLLPLLAACLAGLSRASDSEPEAELRPPEAGSEKARLEYRAKEALEMVREWSSRFGRDIHYGTQEATCQRAIREQYQPGQLDRSRRGDYKANMASVDWTKLHAEMVDTVSTNMAWHREAVEVIAREAEQLAEKHHFEKRAYVDYVDVHRIYNIDERPAPEPPAEEEPPEEELPPEGEPSEGNGAPGQEESHLDASGQLLHNQPEAMPSPARLTSGGDQKQAEEGEWLTNPAYMKLSRLRNFGEVLVNTEYSAVHVPVHIYPGEANVMNAIVWSEQLTRFFSENMIRNPKLFNQYFASQTGFLRVFPAQRWPIARSEPDLYDGRMRPWYVAGASSRKDVVILVDSSGSMTGSRRDIAKGVVFEILDTLTDNDHFMVLKFSDSVQQLAVPNCEQMRVKSKASSIPAKNKLFGEADSAYKQELVGAGNRVSFNESDLDSFYMLPASGKNVRHVKTNFTIPTSGIANFSRALMTAFEVLNRYQQSEQYGTACNQAIMLITDGSPSSFEEIFETYNYPNAPVRVFTYLIGREAGDVSPTKMMACHNRGYYTHVINLAEVRETVQQYIPVMARPLVLNGSHPITWTPAYGDLTYQSLTDWIWESKRRERAKAILAQAKRQNSLTTPELSLPVVVNDDDLLPEDLNFDPGTDPPIEEELDRIDLFGYQSNPDCFWQTHQNELLTTVVQPVYDHRNQSLVTEKFLVKNSWTVKETLMRTAQILGVAAADMKIDDIAALAPSHKLGPNGYVVMLTNNGFAMHHPDLRSVLEPFGSDPAERNMRILKPHFSSVDFSQLEHVLEPNTDEELLMLRNESVMGKTGWQTLMTKRSLDCQKRVQTRRQSFYYKTIKEFPFPFIIAIPEVYGGHRLEAEVEIKLANLPEKLTNYFTTSDYDLWTVHPKYSYCEGPSNNTIATLLDVFQRVEAGKLDDIQWRPAESQSPPIQVQGKIVCDKELLQSLVFDALATFGFSENCGPPNPNAESSLLSMFGVRFAFVATRNGLTRVRHFDIDDVSIKKEALAFARKHARAVDETFYQRTVDYNLLINDTATLIQVPFNAFERIEDILAYFHVKDASSSSEESSLDLMGKLECLQNSSINLIASQSVLVNEGAQRAVAGVTGVFYNYASFAIRFFNATSGRFSNDADGKKKQAVCYSQDQASDICDDSKVLKCGQSDDSIDCLLVDNNGYIIVSENLSFIGKHLKAYDARILERLLERKVFHEVNITDYQAVCMKAEEKSPSPSSSSAAATRRHIQLYATKLFSLDTIASNLLYALAHTWALILAASTGALGAQLAPIQQPQQPILPNKTYLRPCVKTHTLYETRPTNGTQHRSQTEYYQTECACKSWFVYEQVPNTNLLMLIVDVHGIDCEDYQRATNCHNRPSNSEAIQSKFASTDEEVCSIFARDVKLDKRQLDSCFSKHPEEEHIKICGAATKSNKLNLIMLTISISFYEFFRRYLRVSH